MRRTTFVSLVAQSENLGDLVIRKNAVEAACAGGKVIALTSGMPDSYLRAYDLPSGSQVVSSPLRFQFLLLVETLRRRADLLIAPGPVTLTRKLSRLLKAAVVLGDSALIVTFGGRVLSLGRSYRGSSAVAVLLEKTQKAISTVYFVRDEKSREVIGESVEVRPDMAFMAPQIGAHFVRDTIAVSVRDVNSKTINHLRELRDLAHDRGMNMVFVTQVKHDEDIHSRLASELGVTHLAWGRKGHAEQLREVMELYCRSAAVVSNRLHALIFGVQAGSAAIAVEPERHPKLQSTLADYVPFVSLSNILDGEDDPISIFAKLQTESNSAWVETRNELIRGLQEVIEI